MAVSFIHLRLHTEFSLTEGLVQVDDLVAEVTKQGSPAVAITDRVNLFAAVKFYQAAMAAGIKPILGADCWLNNESNPKQPFRLTFLCQNLSGYKNLTRLISRAYQQGQQSGVPLLEKAWLAEYSNGLIVLSGAHEGDIGQALLANKLPLAEELLQQWLQLFPDRFYVELQRTGRNQEEDYIQAVVQLAQQYQTPVVATNDVHFLFAEDFEAHEARVCIANSYTLADPRRPHHFNSEQYLRTPEEMARLFADIPSALTNTVEIAKRCNLELSLGKSYLPNFPIPADLTIEKYLAQQATEGLAQRFPEVPLNDANNKYVARLQVELSVINSMGFAGYFLIVADFIRWAKENNIPVGPGRGSGAGSLVAYALQITDLDPLQYDLLFERFLNPERVSMPDFDIDFCMDGRDRVIEYVSNRYGSDAVCQIITYGSMAARAVVRDVGRVLGYPYGMVDKLAKLIPFEIGITLEKALKQEEELQRRYEQEDEIRVLIDLARKLEGLTRNVGKHAAGVVIAPTSLTEFTPLYCEPGGANLVTQFDMEDIQTVGLVKFDFLGLRTLTIIDWAVNAINAKRQQQNATPIDISKIPIHDAETFALLKACATTAIFQLESRGMKDLIKRLKPDCFEDIIALVALFRPGPLQSGMVDDFINRKHGQAKVEYLHPSLEPILRPTYGIILYQEQVMQIAQVLAGYSLGAADLLRRAMGKKKPEEMAKQREIFLSGAKERNVTTQVATAIFDLMEKFADYGFNKSHSAAYALVSYQTAWLKAHFPADFMAAGLSSDMDHTDKVVLLLDECKHMKLQVLPPDINRSQYKFTVDADNAIVYGLGAVKGVGESAIESIISCRNEQGLFRDIFDLCQRTGARKINRRTLEALIRAGALDSLGTNRASLLATMELALQNAEQQSQANAGGQQDLFGDATQHAQQPNHIVVKELSREQILEGEKATLGFYLSGHPLQRYEQELAQFISLPLAELNPQKTQSVVVAGWVVGLRTLFTKRGDRMAILLLEDSSGRLELPVFSEAFNNHKELLSKDRLLIVEGEVTIDEFTGNYRVLTRRLLDITEARACYGKELVLKVSPAISTPTFFEQLQEVLKPYCKGNCPILIEYHRGDSVTHLPLGSKWRVQPSDELIDKLGLLLGSDAVAMSYPER